MKLHICNRSLISQSRLHALDILQLRRIENLEPTSLRGGFGVIFKGELLGRLVAVKEIQAVGRTTEQFLKVSMDLVVPRKL